MLKFQINDVVSICLDKKFYPLSKSDYGWHAEKDITTISAVIIGTYDGLDMTSSQYLIHDPSNKLKASLCVNLPYAPTLNFVPDYNTKYLNNLTATWVEDTMINGFGKLPDGVFCKSCGDYNKYISTINWVCYYCTNYKST